MRVSYLVESRDTTPNVARINANISLTQWLIVISQKNIFVAQIKDLMFWYNHYDFGLKNEDIDFVPFAATWLAFSFFAAT